MNKITLQTLLKSGVHFGHQTRYWNPKIAPYLYGVRSKIHIMDLDKTLPLFQEALDYVAQVIRNKGKILFVGTKHSARQIVKEEAVRAGMPYVNYRWLGGMLTNYRTIRQSIKRLKTLEESGASKSTQSLTKKERLNLDREKTKLSNCLEGVKNMGSLPDAIFLLDVKQEKTALTEAKRLGIPVIGIVDTNSSPEGVDYLIPGNDDATRAIRLYCETFAETIIEERAAAQREMLAIKQQAESAEEKSTKKEA